MTPCDVSNCTYCTEPCECLCHGGDQPRSEQWRPAVGHEGDYEVSDRGRVRSLPGYKRRGQILRPGVTKNGYQFVGLWQSGSVSYARVHRLVAAAFRDRDPDQDVVRHLDGNQANNRADNLAWGTASDNNYDTVRHGKHPQASKTHCDQGHEFTPDNIYWRGHHRRCKTCHRGGKPAYEPFGCGTRAAYVRHRNHGEQPCAPCRAANSAYSVVLRQRRNKVAA